MFWVLVHLILQTLNTQTIDGYEKVILQGRQKSADYEKEVKGKGSKRVKASSIQKLKPACALLQS